MSEPPMFEHSLCGLDENEIKCGCGLKGLSSVVPEEVGSKWIQIFLIWLSRKTKKIL